jgi:hypothetical protein
MRALTVAVLLLTMTRMAAASPSLVLYDDQLQGGFGDYYSWAADYSFADTSHFHTGTDSIRFKPDNWGGVRIRLPTSELNLSSYSSLTFWVYGTAPGAQKINLFLQRTRAGNNPYPATIAIAEFDNIGTYATGGSIGSGLWRQVTIDFNNEGLTFENFDILIFQADSSTSATQPAVFIDDMMLTGRSGALPAGGTVSVNVNASIVGNAINPLIFGVAYGDATRNGQMGYTVRRWGGNSTTRYNWQVDTDNKAFDYLFLNEPEGSGTGLPANSTADQFVSEAKSAGAQPLITIPTINWTPKDRAKRPGFSVAKYGPQANTECTINPFTGCDADAGDGYCNSAVNTTGHCNGGIITGNDPADTSIAAPPSFEQNWIVHLQSVFGNAAGGGVKFYSLDNEAMLWNSTHRDVHPIPPTYDEIFGKTLDYAAAIKTQDPNALVTGPVTWGYPDLFTSSADTTNCTLNCFQGSDRNAHSGLPFVAWYLQQVCANPLAGGKHLVDYLDLHYYPQGDAGEDDRPAAAAAPRTRALKELYDPTWTSESWIGTVDGPNGDDPLHYPRPDLFPRVHAWIDQYCPGTKLLISEYDWGADDLVSSSIVQAEGLAIYAREGLDMATRWTAPGSGSYAERGFQIFLNYDGAGAKVQGDSVAATSSNVDQIGAYAFHLSGQRTMVLLTNKDTVTHDVALTFDSTQSGTWKLYGFSSATALAQIGPPGSINGTTLTLSALPPMSASLLVIPEIDEIFKDGFGG